MPSAGVVAALNQTADFDDEHNRVVLAVIAPAWHLGRNRFCAVLSATGTTATTIAVRAATGPNLCRAGG